MMYIDRSIMVPDERSNGGMLAQSEKHGSNSFRGESLQRPG